MLVCMSSSVIAFPIIVQPRTRLGDLFALKNTLASLYSLGNEHVASLGVLHALSRAFFKKKISGQRNVNILTDLAIILSYAREIKEDNVFVGNNGVLLHTLSTLNFTGIQAPYCLVVQFRGTFPPTDALPLTLFNPVIYSKARVENHPSSSSMRFQVDIPIPWAGNHTHYYCISVGAPNNLVLPVVFVLYKGGKDGLKVLSPNELGNAHALVIADIGINSAKHLMAQVSSLSVEALNNLARGIGFID